MSRNLTNINASIRTLNNLEHTSIAGTNLNKVGNILNLDTDIINLDTINTFKIDLTLNNTDNQFLVKSISYTDGDILQVDSNNKLNKITVDSILGNIVAGTNITKTNNTLNLDSNLTNLSLINTFKIGLSAITNASTLLRNSETLYNGDSLQINSQGFIVGVSLIENKNAILGTDNTSGIIASTNMSKSVDTNGNITLTSTNTEYTAGTNISISAQNVISSDQQTTLTFNSGQKLKGTGTSPAVRDIAYVNSDNDIIFGDSLNNCGFSVATGIYFLGDGTPLISNLRLFSSSGLNNTGIINNLSGNINLTNENKINFNNDANNSIGSQSALAGVEIKGFNNVLIKTSVTNKPSVNVGQTAIKCKGIITGEFLTGTTERDLLQVLTDNSIQLGDADTTIKFVSTATGGLYINSITNPVLTGTGTANLQGLSMNAGDIDIVNGDINMINSKNIYFNGMVDNLNFIGSSTAVDGVYLQGSNIVKIGTQGGNTSAILTVQQTKINFKGKISGQYTYNGNERDLLQLTQNEDIEVGDAVCEITLKGSNIGFEGFSSFNNDIQMVQDKKLYFDIAGLLGNSNWIKSTTDDNQNGLNIHGSTGVKISTQSYTGEIFLNQNNLEISVDLTTFDNDITATSTDLSLNGDFIGTDCDMSIDGELTVGGDIAGSNCDINIDGDIKLALLSRINFDRANTTTIYNYIRANGNITLNNTPTGQYTSGGTEIYGYNCVKLAQTFNPTVNIGEFWVSGAKACVFATTFNYPTGGGSGSDDRIKFNEIPVNFDCLEIIKNLQVEVYDKHFIKDKDKFMDREIGIIAQDTYNKIKNQVDSATADLFVNEIDYTIPSNFNENGDIVEDQMKRIIHTDMVTGETTETIEENILAVSYIRFISVLIKSQQQQQEIINKQQEQINQQQIIIDKLINSNSFKNFKSSI